MLSSGRVTILLFPADLNPLGISIYQSPNSSSVSPRSVRTSKRVKERGSMISEEKSGLGRTEPKWPRPEGPMRSVPMRFLPLPHDDDTRSGFGLQISSTPSPVTFSTVCTPPAPCPFQCPFPAYFYEHSFTFHSDIDEESVSVVKRAPKIQLR